MSTGVGAGGEGNSTSLVSNVRLIGGGIYGVISWVVGFAAVTALFVDRVGLDTLDFGNENFEFVVDFFAWVFYGAHTVDTEISAQGQSQTISFFSEYLVDDTLIFHVVPAVLLLVSGYIVATRVPRALDPIEGAVAGASVAVGYGILTVVGATYFTHDAAGISYAPVMADSVIYMAVGYPVAFGGLGGLLKAM